MTETTNIKGIFNFIKSLTWTKEIDLNAKFIKALKFILAVSVDSNVLKYST